MIFHQAKFPKKCLVGISPISPSKKRIHFGGALFGSVNLLLPGVGSKTDHEKVSFERENLEVFFAPENTEKTYEYPPEYVWIGISRPGKTDKRPGHLNLHEKNNC